MEILSLADVPEFLPQIARWNNEEWPSYYDGEFDKALEYHRQTMTKNTVPTCFAAVEGSTLAGTVSLLLHDMEIRAGYSPWLGSLYVSEQYRGRGLARQLIQHCMAAAARQKVESLYVWTRELRPLFESLGWDHLESVEFLDEQVDILLFKPAG